MVSTRGSSLKGLAHEINVRFVPIADVAGLFDHLVGN